MAGLYLSQITRFTVSSSIISSRADGWIQSAREAIRSMNLEKGRQIAKKSIIQPPGNWVSTDSLRIKLVIVQLDKLCSYCLDNLFCGKAFSVQMPRHQSSSRDNRQRITRPYDLRP
jgi:hypothetical protein